MQDKMFIDEPFADELDWVFVLMQVWLILYLLTA